MRLLAWSGILAPLLRLGLILLLGALHPDYSQARDFISELGAPDAPFPAVMNLLGISLVGLLLVAFSVPLLRSQPPGPLGTAGSLLLAVSGVAFAAVGLLPCDRPGCSPDAPSAVMQGHLVAGLTAMTTQTLAALAFGLRVFSGTGPRWYAATSLALGLAALLALGLLLATGLRPPAPGMAQKVMQFSADGWVLISAVALLRAYRNPMS
jgi:hypothetical membrane protein